jgi:hypothetical protein
MKMIIFIGNARCYHTMDWYRSVRSQYDRNYVFVATDLINSEAHKVIIRNDDWIVDLFNIDRFLLKKQSKSGDIWRNIAKLLFFPLQVLKLKSLAKKYPDSVYHAHTMYYIFVCWMAGIKCIGTPQGSEILVRPKKSQLYKYFAIKSLQAARIITVDSVAMRDGIQALSGVKAEIIQNGVDVDSLILLSQSVNKRDKYLSIRGMTRLYRIKNILEARERADKVIPLHFIYPFWDDTYKKSLRELFIKDDNDIGRLDKNDMYNLLASSVLVFSIPESDSSPRSVYEAIFAGVIVAATYAPWVDMLPICMRSRLFLVDLEDPSWFNDAIIFANKKCNVIYQPSKEAFDLFDQKQSMSRMISEIYHAN